METSSLFTEALDMILDESKQYSIMMQNIYYVTEEIDLVNFVLKKIDLKKIFKFIFDKFIEAVKALWGKFKALYHQFTDKNSLIKRYKNKLEKLDHDVKIGMERSIFTNLDTSINISMYKMSLQAQYGELVGKLEEISKCRTIEQIHTKIVDIKNDLEDLNTFLGNARGLAIGSRSNISKEEFAEQVSNYYMPDKKISSNTVSPTEVKAYLNEYFQFKNIEKSITKDENILRSSAEDMKSKMDKLDITKYCPNQPINNDISSMFVSIIKEYCNRVQGLCDIYLQLFSIKLDAFKKYKDQQIKVLSKVILVSMKEGKM